WASGTVTAATYNPHGCDVPATCTTRTTMIQALFPGGSYDITSFNFEYQSSDGSLYYRHWQDKSARDGGEKFEGDIATSYRPPHRQAMEGPSSDGPFVNVRVPGATLVRRQRVILIGVVLWYKRRMRPAANPAGVDVKATNGAHLDAPIRAPE